MKGVLFKMVMTLEMVFRNESGKTVTITVASPKDTLTGEQVTTVMNDIIAKNIFSTTSGDLNQIVEARIRQLDVVALT